MTEYFAVLDGFDRRAPFDSICESVVILKQTSRARSHTDKQAHDFCLHQSWIERVGTIDGKMECLPVSWQAREESGRSELPLKGMNARSIVTARKPTSESADFNNKAITKSPSLRITTYLPRF